MLLVSAPGAASFAADAGAPDSPPMVVNVSTPTASTTSSTAPRVHACCLPDGTCAEMGERRCGRLGGGWEPPGSDPFCVPGICAGSCRIVFGVEFPATYGAIQFEVDYGAADGQFTGAGTEVRCESLFDGSGLAVYNDDEVARVLGVAIAMVVPFEGPQDLTSCEYGGFSAGVSAGDFGITTTDAATPGLAPILRAQVAIARLDGCPEITTTTLPPLVCGAPVSRSIPPTATDALAILRTATRLDACEPCACDVDSSGAVSATDALLVMQAATGGGMSTELRCPACASP